MTGVEVQQNKKISSRVNMNGMIYVYTHNYYVVSNISVVC